MSLSDSAAPVSGQLRIVVIRATSLRLDEAGNKPDSFVKMKVLKNIKSAEQPPQWDSSVVPDSCDPEYDQECVLEVTDAAASQLEVTLWNSKAGSNPQTSFWGECILNLSKLIPYAGNIIEQDFDVKQGKQIKTTVPASGKLMLQIMFQTQEQMEASALEEQETQNSSVLSAGTAGTGPAIPSSPFALSLTIIEARDLPNNAAGDPPETFACVSIIDEPAEMQDRHFHLVDHDLTRGKEQSSMMKIAPLHWGKSLQQSNNPAWNDGCTLNESHPRVVVLDQLHQEGKLASSSLRTKLEGKPVVFIITVHDRDAYNAGQSSFIGRVVLPEIEAGKPVDQWFMVQTQDGSQIEGPSGRPSGLHLQIVYGRASVITSLAAPNVVPHTLVAVPEPAKHSPVASPRPPPVPPQAGETASSAASEEHGGTRFAFHVEIVEARNLSTVAGAAPAAPFVCVSLVTAPELMEESDFYLLDHQVGDDADVAQLYCLPPSCRCKPALSGGADPTWKESYTVYAAQPSIRRIADLHAADRLQTPPELVELEGHPVLLLASVHDHASAGPPVLCGRFLIPHVQRGQPVDQWFKLHDRDGEPVLGQSSAQPASVRLRFAYGAVRPSPPPSVTSTEGQGGDDSLPPGWEKKMDPSGRMFYVNHTHRTFSWTPPPPQHTIPSTASHTPPQTPAQASPRLPPTVHAQASSPQPMTLDEHASPPSPPQQQPPSPSKASPSAAAPPRQPSPTARSLSPSLSPQWAPPADRQSPSPLQQPKEAISSGSVDTAPDAVPPQPAAVEQKGPKNAGYAIPGPLYPPKPSLHQAKVFVTVVEGAGMPQTDPNGACDAFCEVFLAASGFELASARTAVCPTTASPIWNEQLTFGVDADQVSLVDLKVLLKDWNAEGGSVLLGQLRRVPLTELMHNKTMDVWLRASPTDDAGQPLPAHGEGRRAGPDLDKCIVRLSLQYEPPQVDAAVGSVLLDPAQPPQTTMPVGEQGAAFITAEQSIKRSEEPEGTAASPGRVVQAGGGDAGVGMVLKVGDKGQFVVELLAEGSPAALSGKIAPGDIVLDVDGQALAAKTLPEVQQMLRGEQHSPVTMALLHYIPGAHTYGAQQVVVTVLRSKMNLPISAAAPPPARPALSPPSSLPSPPPAVMLPTGEPVRPLGVSSSTRSPQQGRYGVDSFGSKSHLPVPPRPGNTAVTVPSDLGQAAAASPPLDSTATLLRRAEEARRQSEAVARQERHVLSRPGQLASNSAHADPLAHLKGEFEMLMNDIYTNRPDPDMAKSDHDGAASESQAAEAPLLSDGPGFWCSEHMHWQVHLWKKKLLYGTADTPGSTAARTSVTALT